MRAAVRRTARFDIVQLLYFRNHPYSVNSSVNDVAFAFSRRTQLSRCFSVPKQAWSFVFISSFVRVARPIGRAPGMVFI